MTAFIGIDLAWTDHRESGVCVLVGDGEGVELALVDAYVDTPEGFAELCAGYGDDVVVAVDAPLVVGPERRAEAELARVYGRYKASPYSANLAFLDRNKFTAPLAFARELRRLGFEVVPSVLELNVKGRVAVEVFPHPAHVRLFDLPERLHYKKGPLGKRRPAFREYEDYLGKLLGRELPAVATGAQVQALLASDAVEVPGRALKRLEDQLDALTCAYVAYHLWRHGAGGFEVFGSDEQGAIVVPLVPPVLHPVGGGHAHQLEDAREGDA